MAVPDKHRALPDPAKDAKGKRDSAVAVGGISSLGSLAMREVSNFSAAKAALIGMTRTLSLELARDGITINVVAPGPVATNLFDNGHPTGSDKRQRVIESIPVRRVGTTDDVARAVTFLLDPESGYITGQTLFVCGGTSVSGTGGN